MGLIKWFKSLFGSVRTFIKRLWDLAQPFLAEALTTSAKLFLDESKELLLEAIDYVEKKGLPTSKDKQTLFYNYMTEKAKNSWTDLKESETDLLRQIALAIYKRAKSG